jgi:hypothetical protein
MLYVQFNGALQSLCIAIGKSRIVVDIDPVLGQVCMDKRGVKANTQKMFSKNVVRVEPF